MNIMPLVDAGVGDGRAQISPSFSAVVTLVLLIACNDVANLCGAERAARSGAGDSHGQGAAPADHPAAADRVLRALARRRPPGLDAGDLTRVLVLLLSSAAPSRGSRRRTALVGVGFAFALSFDGYLFGVVPALVAFHDLNDKLAEFSRWVTRVRAAAAPMQS